MKAINRTYAPLEAFVDELARCGVEHAVASPGSRNAPILLSLAANEHIRTWSVIDERSAAFVALGIAKAGGRPAIVTCTSGTAAANLLPAVVEAREARVPLIVLTADRPPELREVGAGQSIDQLKLFGSHVNWFVEVGNLAPGRESAVHHRALACRAWATARDGRPGPVHLNFPLREPLAPVAEALDTREWEGRPGGKPWVDVTEAPRTATEADVERLAREITAVPRGALVAGPGRASDPAGESALAEAAATLADAAGWPLLAEPTSGARCGAHDRSQVIAHYDALLRAPGWEAAHRPDLVVRVGDTPTSKPLRGWLAEARQIVIDPHAAWHEPTRAAERVVVADPALTCRAVAGRLKAQATRDLEWLCSWRAADARVTSALAEVEDPFEPKAVVAAVEAASPETPVWISSSMPIRDLETFLPALPESVRLLANRGANGIDGVVSSALGAAAASSGQASLVTGELALLHDVGALLAARRLGLELTVVCLNNGGGGIFDFLPVAEHADPATYEALVATPSGVDLERLADAAGLPHVVASTADDVRAAAAAPGLVEVRTDRRTNVERHRELFASLARELDATA